MTALNVLIGSEFDLIGPRQLSIAEPGTNTHLERGGRVGPGSPSPSFINPRARDGLGSRIHVPRAANDVVAGFNSTGVINALSCLQRKRDGVMSLRG